MKRLLRVIRPFGTYYARVADRLHTGRAEPYGAPGLNTATLVQRRNCWRKILKKFRHIYNPRRGLGRKQTDEFGVLEHFQPFLVKSSPKYTWWTLSSYKEIGGIGGGQNRPVLGQS